MVFCQKCKIYFFTLFTVFSHNSYTSSTQATINQEFRQPQDVPQLNVCVYEEGEYVVKTLNKVEMAEMPKFYVEPNGLHPVTGLTQLYYMGDPEEQGIDPMEFGIQIALVEN
jgi:hypothetical protein